VKRRDGARELLDGDLDVKTLEGNLRDLARLNHMLDGAGVSYRAVRALRGRGGGRLRLLDVGTGAADIALALRRSAPTAAAHLEVVATDVRPEIVGVARRNAAGSDIAVKEAPPDRIDEQDRSFDIVHSSMVLHHLEPDAAVAALREMARVARRAVIVNDLDRGRHWLLIARLLSTVFTRNAYTRNDAPLSVQRAYRPDELAQLALEAGLVEEERRWAWPRYRYAITFRHAERDRG
jgi:ubiquinone/menaquinone biosynthesis C-methylase UbiE